MQQIVLSASRKSQRCLRDIALHDRQRRGAYGAIQPHAENDGDGSDCQNAHQPQRNLKLAARLRGIIVAREADIGAMVEMVCDGHSALLRLCIRSCVAATILPVAMPDVIDWATLPACAQTHMPEADFPGPALIFNACRNGMVARA